jgi:DNA polymerase-3 subunit delta
MIAIEQIKQLVKNQALPKVIALAGSERALMDDALAAIRSYGLSLDKEGLNYYRYRAGEDKLDKVVNALKTVPFLAEQKLVELHDAEKINAADGKELIEYINNPSNFSVLVVVFNKIDKRSKLFSIFEEKKSVFLFEPLSEKDTLAFIKSQAELLGIKIDQESASFLQLSLDGDMLAIRSTLEKISLVYENKSPSLDELAQNVIGDAMMDVFRLARIISEGDLKNALVELNRLRLHQENALKFLGVLVWQFRVLVHIRDCVDRGLAEWDIRKEVSVFGDRFTWMLRVAKKRNISFHINRLTRLLQCDIFLKSQKTADPLSIIEKAVYQSAVGG